MNSEAQKSPGGMTDSQIAKQYPEAASRIALMQADQAIQEHQQVSQVAKIVWFSLALACIKALYALVALAYIHAFETNPTSLISTYFERYGLILFPVITLYLATLIALYTTKNQRVFNTLFILTGVGLAGWFVYDTTHFAVVSLLFDLLLAYELYRLSQG